MTERLADLQYVALVLFALLGMSYDVIGAHMGLTLPKLERRLLGGRGRRQNCRPVCPRPSPPTASSRSRLARSYIAGEIEEVNLDNGGAARCCAARFSLTLSLTRLQSVGLFPFVCRSIHS